MDVIAVGGYNEECLVLAWTHFPTDSSEFCITLDSIIIMSS